MGPPADAGGTDLIQLADASLRIPYKPLTPSLRRHPYAGRVKTPQTGQPSHGQMAVKKENLEVDSAAARVRPIELLTENGFSIVRVGEGASPTRSPDRRYAFVVSDPKGSERGIEVEIDQQAVGEITRRSRGRISSDSSYWICCAERHLAEYLWKTDNYPPDGKLRVEQLTLDDVNLAIRWQTT